MGDVVTSGLFNDDWDVSTVNDMFSELSYYTVFEDEDLYLNQADSGDLYCYHHYAHHYLHRANFKRQFFTRMQ